MEQGQREEKAGETLERCAGVGAKEGSASRAVRGLGLVGQCPCQSGFGGGLVGEARLQWGEEWVPVKITFERLGSGGD